MINVILAEPFILGAIVVILGFLAWSAIRVSAVKAELKHSSDPEKRLPVYNHIMASLWGLAAVSVAAWLLSGRSLAELGFRSDPSLGLWLAWGFAAVVITYYGYELINLARSAKARSKFRKLAEGAEIDLVSPTTPREHKRFQLVSITAGITEEIVFRGFLIGAFALALPVWLAAIAATALFVLGHVYQGVSGMMRILPISIAFAAMFVISGSLWPCILLHIAVDAGLGAMLAVTQSKESDDLANAAPSAA